MRLCQAANEKVNSGKRAVYQNIQFIACQFRSPSYVSQCELKSCLNSVYEMLISVRSNRYSGCNQPRHSVRRAEMMILTNYVTFIRYVDMATNSLPVLKTHHDQQITPTTSIHDSCHLSYLNNVLLGRSKLSQQNNSTSHLIFNLQFEIQNYQS